MFSKKPKEVNDMQSTGKESGKKRKSGGGAVNRGTVVKCTFHMLWFDARMVLVLFFLFGVIRTNLW